MTYVMIHVEHENSGVMPERYMVYGTEAERDAQLEHDIAFFPGKTFFTARLDDDGQIVDRTPA